ncbi:hypothetical protein ACQR1W_31375 [Bradyrhizobium sp. HKCCYLS1011]
MIELVFIQPPLNLQLSPFEGIVYAAVVVVCSAWFAWTVFKG